MARNNKPISPNSTLDEVLSALDDQSPKGAMKANVIAQVIENVNELKDQIREAEEARKEDHDAVIRYMANILVEVDALQSAFDDMFGTTTGGGVVESEAR